MALRAFCTVCVIALAAIAASASGARAQSSAPTFQQVVDGARKEGKLVVMMNNPSDDANRKKVIAAFNKRFGLSLDVQWPSIHPTRVIERIMAEGPSGKFSGDIASGITDDLLQLVQKGYVKPFTWVETFGTELPGIKGAVAAEVPELRDTLIGYNDAPYLLAWNTQLVKNEADLPRRFEELADPKWKGKLTLNAFHLAPVSYLSQEIGNAKSIDLARRILALNPILKPGSAAAAQAVVAGETPAGIGIYGNLETVMRTGAPIKYRTFDDYLVVPLVSMYVLANPPNPNAARLFAAWMVSEGMKLVEQDEFIGRLSDPESMEAKKLMPMVKQTGAKIVQATALKHYEDLEEVRGTINAMIAGQKGR